MQPTDLGLVGFRVSNNGGRGDREEDERGSGSRYQRLLAGGMAMRRAQLLRISITIAAMVATVFAGGASIKGF